MRQVHPRRFADRLANGTSSSARPCTDVDLAVRRMADGVHVGGESLDLVRRSAEPRHRRPHRLGGDRRRRVRLRSRASISSLRADDGVASARVRPPPTVPPSRHGLNDARTRASGEATRLRTWPVTNPTIRAWNGCRSRLSPAAPPIEHRVPVTVTVAAVTKPATAHARTSENRNPFGGRGGCAARTHPRHPALRRPREKRQVLDWVGYDSDLVRPAQLSQAGQFIVGAQFGARRSPSLNQDGHASTVTHSVRELEAAAPEAVASKERRRYTVTVYRSVPRTLRWCAPRDDCAARASKGGSTRGGLRINRSTSGMGQ